MSTLAVWLLKFKVLLEIPLVSGIFFMLISLLMKTACFCMAVFFNEQKLRSLRNLGWSVHLLHQKDMNG